MDEEVFNMQLRKFLKNVGVTSQREIEGAVRAALDDGSLKGEETIQAKVTLSIESLGVSAEITGSSDSNDIVRPQWNSARSMTDRSTGVR